VTDARDRPSDPSLGGGGGDLLDLVREAEEAATLATRSGPPSDRGELPPVSAEEADVDGQGDGRISGEVVEVGDDAVDAPPSLEPFPAEASLSVEAAPHSGIAEAPRPRETTGETTSNAPRLPPLLAILVVLAIAIASLALLAR
jgi:hypothetical protein